MDEARVRDILRVLCRIPGLRLVVQGQRRRVQQGRVEDAVSPAGDAARWGDEDGGEGMRREKYKEEAEHLNLYANAGAYRTHRACIELDKSLPVFDGEFNSWADLKLTRELPVFVHEYFHFLQNYGTIAGVTELVLWTYVLGAYSRALVSPGAVVESEPSDKDKKLVKQCVSHLDHLQGELGPSGVKKCEFKTADVRYVKIEHNDQV